MHIYPLISPNNYIKPSFLEKKYLMHPYSHKEIVRLYAQFKQLRHYKEKIEFFDTHFGCFEYEFPAFDPAMDILFKPEGIDILSDLFQKERRNAQNLEKRFVVRGRKYIFNIVPINSYPQVLNDYILLKFIHADPNFERYHQEIEDLAIANPAAVQEKKKALLNNINLIGDKLSGDEERSFRSRFMTVFYNGYLDYINNDIKKFPTRKKFIELHLYAQGILYGKYLQVLMKQGNHNYLVADHSDNHKLPEDSSSKLILLKEFGILELLSEKYADLERNMDHKLAGLLCVMLGQDDTLSQRIREYLLNKPA